MKRYITAIFFYYCISSAFCQEHDDHGIGVHIAVDHELLTLSGGRLTTVADHYVVGFPVGYHVYKIGKFTLDMEVVPITDFHNFALLIHPGALMPLDYYGLIAGARVAYELPSNAFGITPLINKEFELNDKLKVFTELVFPVRYHDRSLAISVGALVGVAF